MWLAATVGALLSNGIPCHCDDQQVLSGICYVGSSLCTLGYQMSFSIIQEIRHLVYQYTRTQDRRRCIQWEKILLVGFSYKFGMCLRLKSSVCDFLDIACCNVNSPCQSGFWSAALETYGFNRKWLSDLWLTASVRLLDILFC